MKTMRLMVYVLMAGLILGFQACKESTTEPEQVVINESEVLLQYLESNGDYINTSAPSVVLAADVRTTMLASPTTQYIIDLRSATDFATGHIEGSVNVTMANLLTHVKGLTNASGYARIVINCYSGQTAAYGTAMLRLTGYSNAYSLKWGMSSWDSTFAKNYWSAKISNSRAVEFTTTATTKNAAGSLPVLATGKTTGAEILEARVNALLAAGFSTATVDNNTLFANLTNYYIVNYWPVAQYNSPGHVPGAVQYEPKTDLKSTTAIKTLPTNKPVVVYCYTGTTSAFVSAYLKVLGYDAKTLLYGANAMIYDVMPGSKFVASEIKGYPYVTGP